MKCILLCFFMTFAGVVSSSTFCWAEEGLDFETYSECVSFWMGKGNYPYEAERLCADMLDGESTFGPESEWSNEEPSEANPLGPSTLNPVPGGSGKPFEKGDRGKVQLPEGWGGIVKSTVSDMEPDVDPHLAVLASASAAFLTYILRSKRIRLFTTILKSLRKKSEWVYREVQRQLRTADVAIPASAQ